MPPAQGADFRIDVSLDEGATFIPIADMNAYDMTTERSAEDYPVFGAETAYSLPGARARRYSIGGFLNTTDPGQVGLRAAERDDDTVVIRVRPTGGAATGGGVGVGFTQPVKVGSFRHRATPTGFQEHGFDFLPQGDPVAITSGSGYVI